MRWGYALIWAESFLELDADPLMARLKFLAAHGLASTGTDLESIAVMPDAARDRLGQYLDDHDLALTPVLHTPYFDADPGRVDRVIADQLALLERWHRLLRSPLVTTSVGPYHRFMREPSLDHQLDCLAQRLPAYATACHDLGIPFGIENHGDYYLSDLAGLCQQVPHLGIFLDTGNPYLIGEAPLPAFEAAAPYAVGTHFKDHHVRPCPDARPLHFEVAPAVLGEGDVPLRECYRLLQERNPNPDQLVMQIELIFPADRPPLQSLEQSLAFVRSLDEAAP
jgi:sugar phosphate isomerase/epimerase